MSEPFVGEIRMFAGNFAPRGWAFCDGQLLAVSQNDALFSLLGTVYGGDGRTTFGLPDLRGRLPIHAGTGPGLSPRTETEILAESDGLIIGRANLPVINEGDALFHIAQLKQIDNAKSTIDSLAAQLVGDPLFDEDEII